MDAPSQPNALQRALQAIGWVARYWPIVMKIAYQTVVAVQNLALYFRTGNIDKRLVATNVIIRVIRERFKVPVDFDQRLEALVGSAIELAVAIAKQTLREAWRFDPLPFGQLLGHRTLDKAEALVRSGQLPIPTLKSDHEYLLMAIAEFRAIEAKNALRPADLSDSQGPKE